MNEEIELDMSMVGTTGSQYFRLAQQGDIALGLRFYGLNTLNPMNLNLKDNTYVVFRARIAPYAVEEETSGPAKGGKIFSLGKNKKVSIEDAFPLVSREQGKMNPKRHSGFVGMYLPVGMEDPEKFLEVFTMTYLRKMTNELMVLGGEHTIAPYNHVREFLLRSIGKPMEKALKLKKAKEHLKESEPHDSFGFHIATLQSLIGEAIVDKVDTTGKEEVQEKKNGDVVSFFGKAVASKMIVDAATGTAEEESSEDSESSDDVPF